jgi:hypothetical protein
MMSEKDAILALSLQLLAARSIMVLSLLGGFSLFAWAVYQPDPLRIVAASLFAILVHMPVWYRRNKDAQESRQSVDE